MRILVIFGVSILITLGSNAMAQPIEHTMTERGVDWLSFGVAGIGGGDDGGHATFDVAGISGDVTRAFLYWNGIDELSLLYDNPDVLFDGNPVSGTLIGESGTNCWGPGVSRAYRADVTAFVTGNGSFEVTGLASQPGYDVNGASLVIYMMTVIRPTTAIWCSLREMIPAMVNKKVCPGKRMVGIPFLHPSITRVERSMRSSMSPMGRFFQTHPWSFRPRMVR